MIKSSDQVTGKPVGAQRRPGTPETRRRRRNEAGEVMRARIVEAALRTLLREGYAGTSVRAIAATGSFSPALVFYHFGSVDALLLAVLDQVSSQRLARYRERLDGIGTMHALGAAMEELYTEDLHLGYLAAVQEVVAGMAFDPQLGAELLNRMQPWMTFAATLAARILARSGLEGLIDPGAIGDGVIALYLGLEIVARMRGGDTGGSHALLTALQQAAPWVDRLLGKTRPARRRPPARVAVE